MERVTTYYDLLRQSAVETEDADSIGVFESLTQALDRLGAARDREPLSTFTLMVCVDITPEV